MVSIRAIRPEDAPTFHALRLALDRETSFMMLEPDERSTTAKAARDEIREVIETGRRACFVAASGETLLGYAEAVGGAYRRNRHCAYVVLGVRQTASGQGIGSRLLSRLDRWAYEVGVRRLELTVMHHNERAIALYRRMGYEVEGTRYRAMRVDGGFVDELYMARWLEDRE